MRALSTQEQFFKSSHLYIGLGTTIETCLSLRQGDSHFTFRRETADLEHQTRERPAYGAKDGVSSLLQALRLKEEKRQNDIQAGTQQMTGPLLPESFAWWSQMARLFYLLH